MKISSDVKEDLEFRIMDEGLEYAMLHYSEWEEVEDTKFHELRHNFTKSFNELKIYLKAHLDIPYFI